MEHAEELKQCLEEVLKISKVGHEELIALDEMVQKKLAELQQLAKKLQTQVEHNVIDASEYEHRIGSGWRELAELRLDRIEKTVLAVSKANSASLGLIAKILSVVLGVSP